MLFHKPTRSFTRKETAFFFAQKTQARIIPPHLRLRARMLLVTHPQRASSHSSIRQHVITTRTLTCWTALLTVLTLNTTQDPQSGQDSKDTMVDVVKRNMDTKSEGEGDATVASMSVLSADAGVTSVSGSTTAATHSFKTDSTRVRRSEKAGEDGASAVAPPPPGADMGGDLHGSAAPAANNVKKEMAGGHKKTPKQEPAAAAVESSTPKRKTVSTYVAVENETPTR
jgi:hypothetical protein